MRGGGSGCGISCNESHSSRFSWSSPSKGTPVVIFSDIDGCSIHAQERAVQRLHGAVHADAGRAGRATERTREFFIIIEDKSPEPDHFARRCWNFCECSL